MSMDCHTFFELQKNISWAFELSSQHDWVAEKISLPWLGDHESRESKLTIHSPKVMFLFSYIITSKYRSVLSPKTSNILTPYTLVPYLIHKWIMITYLFRNLLFWQLCIFYHSEGSHPTNTMWWSTEHLPCLEEKLNDCMVANLRTQKYNIASLD